jgi:phospholipid/cholesterol/gamma-HCH transport system substrate-binding protein
MENKKNNVKLGAFIAIGMLLLLFGIYLIGKKQQLFNSTFVISSVFKDINGLQIGSNVRFAGINVGVVENITIIADTAVRIDMFINYSIKKFIKKDAKAIIGTDGLMGNKIVTLLAGSANEKEIKENAFIAAVIPVSIDEIIVNLNVAVQNASTITENLAIITESIAEGRGTVGKLFMDTMMAAELEQTIINIKKGAGGFKDNMDAAGNNVLLRGLFNKKKKKK